MYERHPSPLSYLSFIPKLMTLLYSPISTSPPIIQDWLSSIRTALLVLYGQSMKAWAMIHSKMPLSTGVAPL
jgi:hypothetical protein